MSYELSSALQAAIYRRLVADPALAALVGGAVHDATPDGPGAIAGDYVLLGEESVRPWDTKTSRGAAYDFAVTVHSARQGFDAAKRIAGAVCACLVDAPLEIAGGRLVALRFLQARAERGPAPERRQVALRFRAILDLDD